MNENFTKIILSLDNNYLLEMYHFCNEKYFESYVNSDKIYSQKYKNLINNIDNELRKRDV